MATDEMRKIYEGEGKLAYFFEQKTPVNLYRRRNVGDKTMIMQPTVIGFGPEDRPRLPDIKLEDEAREGAGASAGASASPRSTRKVEPAPGVLSTVSRPPISVTSSLVMARPRPVPTKRRVVDSSACVNGSNSRRCAASLMPMPMPMPESRTSKLTCAMSPSRLLAYAYRRSLPSALSDRARIVLSLCATIAGKGKI